MKLLSGIVHNLHAPFKTALIANQLGDFWNSLTPLARNEWICWTRSAKQEETKTKRIQVAVDKMKKGSRRPCCWPGCSHRSRT